MENTENSVNHEMRSHNASISAISNSFHNIKAKNSMRSASVIFMSCTEAIMHLLQTVIYIHGCRERECEGTKGYKGSTVMQAL